MRTLAVAALAFVTLTACSGGSAGSLATTVLTVTYREDGSATSVPTRWTLRCNPARGTLPRPGVACRRLAEGGPKLFAPVPRNEVCTEIYGGPQVALVTGLVSGRRIWARLSRENGCQIARWNRVSPWLLPSGGVR